jgi:hypothetical protein
MASRPGNDLTYRFPLIRYRETILDGDILALSTPLRSSSCVRRRSLPPSRTSVL